MVLKGENASTLNEPCSIASWTATNPTWTGPRFNTNLRDDWPTSNRLHYGTDNSITIGWLPHAFNLLLQSLGAV